MEENRNKIPPTYDLPLYMRLFPNFFDYYGYENYKKPQKRDKFDEFITLYAFLRGFGFIGPNRFDGNYFGY